MNEQETCKGANCAASASNGYSHSDECLAEAAAAQGWVEQEIVAKGLTAPRVTPADIEANIASEHYFTAAEGLAGREVAPITGHSAVPASLHLLTFCVLVLRNGFTVTGESACASPENFDAELGRKIARENAINELWPLMGYALKERLAAGRVTAMRAPDIDDVEILAGAEPTDVLAEDWMIVE